MGGIENMVEGTAQTRRMGLLDPRLQQIGGLQESSTRHAGTKAGEEVES